MTATMTEGKGGISPYNLIIKKIMNQKYETKKKGDKIVYDIQRALEEDELVKKYYKDLPKELADMLYKVDMATKERYIRIIEPEDHPEGYVRAKDYIGNIASFNRLCDEIRDLIEKGENIKDHSRELQRKYNAKKEIIAGSKDFEGIWNWILKDYKGLTKEEITIVEESLKN